jgi:hypothetical protein
VLKVLTTVRHEALRLSSGEGSSRGKQPLGKQTLCQLSYSRSGGPDSRRLRDAATRAWSTRRASAP